MANNDKISQGKKKQTHYLGAECTKIKGKCPIQRIRNL
jgi:hypothetical protein